MSRTVDVVWRNLRITYNLRDWVGVQTWLARLIEHIDAGEVPANLTQRGALEIARTVITLCEDGAWPVSSLVGARRLLTVALDRLPPEGA